ncbi:MAG: DUF3592 domain-containing protein [Cyclobacteriaceae bacterium]
MTGEIKDQVEKLLRAGERPRAIQYLQETFNISFEDAGNLVAALERETGITPDKVGAPVAPIATTIDGPLKTDVSELLKSGRKLQAVQVVRSNLHVGLREALLLVEEVAREVNPNYVSFNATGCIQLVAKGLGIFLMVVSIFFLAAAAIIYFFQSQSISKSDRVTGLVTEMKSMDTGESAPVVEYEWKGNKRSYQSTYYSSPPDYEVGQTVPLFVNREDPEEVTLDTFTDRWALIVGLAVPGAFLLLVSIVFLYFARRKF